MVKTHDKEKFLDSFIKSLNFILDSKNIHLIVVGLSTYSEYITNQLIKKNFRNRLDDDMNLHHSTKLKFLKGGDIIMDSEYKTLDALRRARNLVVHHIFIDQDEWDTILNKVEINYLDEEAKKSLESQPAQVRFVHGCIIKIFYLISKFYDEERLILSFRSGKYHLLKPNNGKKKT
jgi:hypothetical protein